MYIVILSKTNIYGFMIFISDVCLQMKQTGPCEAYAPSFFFNSSSGMCERFIYGGCGGNGNRFPTGPECLNSCSPDSKFT